MRNLILRVLSAATLTFAVLLPSEPRAGYDIFEESGNLTRRIISTPIDGIWNYILHDLDLEDEERAELSETASRYSFENAGLINELRLKTRELSDIIASDSPRMSRADSLMESISALQGEIYSNRVRVYSKASEILDRGQFTRVRSIFLRVADPELR